MLCLFCFVNRKLFLDCRIWTTINHNVLVDRIVGSLAVESNCLFVETVSFQSKTGPWVHCNELLRTDLVDEMLKCDSLVKKNWKLPCSGTFSRWRSEVKSSTAKLPIGFSDTARDTLVKNHDLVSWILNLLVDFIEIQLDDDKSDLPFKMNDLLLTFLTIFWSGSKLSSCCDVWRPAVRS